MILLDFKRNGKGERNRSIHRQTSNRVTGLSVAWRMESFIVHQMFGMHREFNDENVLIDV